MRAGVLAIVLTATVWSQQGPEGTAVVRGRVVDDATGKPLANIPVQFSPRPNHPFAPGIDVEPTPRSAVTDSNGAFEIAHLTAGDYAVFASTPVPYLSISYGVSRAGGPGKILTVADGAKLDVAIKAWRGASIAGHVVDDRGRPVAGVEVRIFTDRPNVYGSATTNDLGEYEITRLQPGRYA